MSWIRVISVSDNSFMVSFVNINIVSRIYFVKLEWPEYRRSGHLIFMGRCFRYIIEKKLFVLDQCFIKSYIKWYSSQTRVNTTVRDCWYTAIHSVIKRLFFFKVCFSGVPEKCLFAGNFLSPTGMYQMATPLTTSAEWSSILSFYQTWIYRFSLERTEREGRLESGTTGGRVTYVGHYICLVAGSWRRGMLCFGVLA